MQTQIPIWVPVVANIIRFLILAGIPFLVFYVLFSSRFAKLKIQGRDLRSKDLNRELFYSIITVIVFITLSLTVLFTPFVGYTKIYKDMALYHWAWIPLSVLLGIVIHDTYFYWLHRILHHKKIYPLFHRIHHESTNPSPFTSHAFNLTESILEALIIPIVMLLIPMHKWAVLSFVMIALVYNVYGHLGYELVPRWFRKTVLFELMVTSVHHNMHHEKFHGNYGYYFRIWDRLMGTENPNYVLKFDEIQEQRFGKE